MWLLELVLSRSSDSRVFANIISTANHTTHNKFDNIWHTSLPCLSMCMAVLSHIVMRIEKCDDETEGYKYNDNNVCIPKALRQTQHPNALIHERLILLLLLHLHPTLQTLRVVR